MPAKRKVDVAVISDVHLGTYGRHIHQACIKHFHNHEGEATYLNSGDWVESLTALEYSAAQWSLYEFQKDLAMNFPPIQSETSVFLSDKRIFEGILHEVVHD